MATGLVLTNVPLYSNILKANDTNGVTFKNSSDLTVGSFNNSGTWYIGHETTSTAHLITTLGSAVSSSKAHLFIKDSSAMALGVGGGIAFFGKYTTDGTYFGPIIKASKLNATDNNYSFNLDFYSAQHGVVSKLGGRMSPDGAWTFGFPAATGFDNPAHIFNASIASGLTGTADANKRLQIAVNVYSSVWTSLPARNSASNTLGGAMFQVLARTSDTNQCFQFWANKTTDGNTTQATNIGGATQNGEWSFAASAGVALTLTGSGTTNATSCQIWKNSAATILGYVDNSSGWTLGSTSGASHNTYGTFNFTAPNSYGGQAIIATQNNSSFPVQTWYVGGTQVGQISGSGIWNLNGMLVTRATYSSGAMGAITGNNAVFTINNNQTITISATNGIYMIIYGSVSALIYFDITSGVTLLASSGGPYFYINSGTGGFELGKDASNRLYIKNEYGSPQNVYLTAFTAVSAPTIISIV